LHVNNDPIPWTMLNGIKELNQSLEQKDAEIAELKQTVDDLKHMMLDLSCQVKGGNL